MVGRRGLSGNTQPERREILSFARMVATLDGR
jgi:hypothetical protein